MILTVAKQFDSKTRVIVMLVGVVVVVLMAMQRAAAIITSELKTVYN